MQSSVKPTVTMARIIHDTRDAGSDKFIPLTEANKALSEGKLRRLDMGPSYPNSFEEVRSHHATS
jgi:hypothetical protein